MAGNTALGIALLHELAYGGLPEPSSYADTSHDHVLFSPATSAKAVPARADAIDEPPQLTLSATSLPPWGKMSRPLSECPLYHTRQTSSANSRSNRTIACLQAGYINPPEGYKSRIVRAQELRNQQLEEELATLRQLKEREQQLRFELFQATLTHEEQECLEREARQKVNPNLGLSAERQIEVYKEGILKQWFGERETP